MNRLNPKDESDPNLMAHDPSPETQVDSKVVGVTTVVCIFFWAVGVWLMFPERNPALSLAAQQSEARSQLRALAEKQKQHFQRSGRYEYDFEAIGFRPSPPIKYVVGFPTKCASLYSTPTAVISSLELISRGVASQDKSIRTMTAEERERIATQLDRFEQHNCPDPKTGFVAIAVGNIDQDSGFDIWTINESFELMQVEADF